MANKSVDEKRVGVYGGSAGGQNATGAVLFMGSLGMGLAAPSSANAGLHLVPEQAAAVSGLRVLFRQAGAIIAVSVVRNERARSAGVQPSSLALSTSFSCRRF